MAEQRKRKRPSEPRRRTRERIAVGVLAAASALLWWVFGDRARELGGLAGPSPPAHGDALRVVTWNLENFGDAGAHDLARLREIIEQLDPDVLALQEIKQADALAALLPGWEITLSDAGGRGQQRLGVAVRPERVELLAHAEHAELSLDGRVCPGFSAYLRGREHGPDFWLVVVHLKAMPDAIDLRREQWPRLVELVGALGREGEPGAGDLDLVVVGDFNTTGPLGAGPDGPRIEQTELAGVLGGVGLRRLPNANGCTAYYDGQRRDAWKEPSEIDLVWVRGLEEALAADTNVFSGTHCASERCRDFRSTQAHPQRDFERVSDHCPVVLDLGGADDDP